MKITFRVLLVLALLSLCNCGSGQKAENERQISVTGIASFDIPPDHVKIRVSIVTMDKSYEAAYSTNTGKVKKALAALAAIGIPKKDIWTGYVSLGKREAERDNNVPVFLGYEAANDLNIILRDLSKYDSLLPSIIKMGVNKIESVTFGIMNEPEKAKEARLQAIKAAKEKADYLAAALGQKVCRPIKIAETPENNASQYSNSYYYAAPGDVHSSLAPCNIRIKASVDVTFLLCD